MNIKFILSTTCACLSIVSYNVNAALVSTDWQMAGDNLITLDTDNSLEWLDLTVTADYSYNDINSKLGVGQEFEGWRYATSGEVTGLFDSAGGSADAPYDGATAGHTAWVPALLSLWGTTSTSPNYSRSFFLLDDQYLDGPWHYYGSLTDYALSFDVGSDWAHIAEYGWTGDGTWDWQRGSALVRGNVVPVPAAIWLFGSGLLGLIGVSRRKA